jgi:hypothetical protein
VEWGDALLIVLDPYGYGAKKPSDDGWGWTLGKGQYDWVSGILSRSEAAYRFVFIHQMVGGKGSEARGGADLADYFEWGGSGPDGKDEFAAKRPGWPMPLGDLFLKYGVDAVFHGHDHFYAREEKDGMIYQLVPQPSSASSRQLNASQLAEYGYASGTFLPAPGYLRVSVSPERARIEYVRSEDGSIGHAYDISP